MWAGREIRVRDPDSAASQAEPWTKPQPIGRRDRRALPLIDYPDAAAYVLIADLGAGETTDSSRRPEGIVPVEQTR